jgi:large subunit ribosomal protein L22
MKAILKNYRQSPRKVRLIAGLVRGKSTSEALAALNFIDKRAAGPFAKVIQSAVANAKNQGKSVDKLFVKTVQVDKGTTLKRSMPRARGSASRINKRNSHISVELGEKNK